MPSRVGGYSSREQSLHGIGQHTVTAARPLRELTSKQCWGYLEGQVIGRVGWNTLDGPEILPVNYVVHKETVIFRTAAYGPMAELHDPRRVVFQIDAFDADQRTGWSVVVHGTARAVRHPEALVEVWAADPPEPWAEGNRHLIIAITPARVSGREITVQG